jgi:CRP-like cAMP-binding protein
MLRHGEVCDKIFVLVTGKIEIFVTISGENGPEELIMDTLEEPGCVMNQVSMLKRFKLNYSARAKTDVEVMVISYEDL